MNSNKPILLLSFYFAVFANTNAQDKKSYPKTNLEQFATVVNIDWPKAVRILLRNKKRIILKF
jgi:hypothetical protein